MRATNHYPTIQYHRITIDEELDTYIQKSRGTEAMPRPCFKVVNTLGLQSE